MNKYFSICLKVSLAFLKRLMEKSIKPPYHIEILCTVFDYVQEKFIQFKIIKKIFTKYFCIWLRDRIFNINESTQIFICI